MQTFEFEGRLSEKPEDLEPKIIFNYNSDLSGDVIISKENPMDPAEPQTIEIPGEAILEFVAEYVRTQRISQLEEASTNDIFGVNQPPAK